MASNGDYVRDENGEPKIQYKGVMAVRRDYTKWSIDIFKKISKMCLFDENYYYIVKYLVECIVELFNGDISADDLSVTTKMGDRYKNKVYKMNRFKLKLDRQGKPAQPGDRLTYVIIKDDDAQYVGDRCELLESFNESTDLELDYMYYIEKQLETGIDQIISTCYKDIRKIPFQFPTYKIDSRSNINRFKLDNPVKIMRLMIERGLDFRYILNILELNGITP